MKSKIARNNKIIAYKKKGMSLNQIGRIFHLSKQRIWVIVKKAVSPKELVNKK